MHGPALNTCLRMWQLTVDVCDWGIGIQWSKECCQQQHTHPNVSEGRLATDWPRPMPPIEVGSGGLPRCHRTRVSLWKACPSGILSLPPTGCQLLQMHVGHQLATHIGRQRTMLGAHTGYHSGWCPTALPSQILSLVMHNGIYPLITYSVLDGSQLSWHSPSLLWRKPHTHHSH